MRTAAAGASWTRVDRRSLRRCRGGEKSWQIPCRANFAQQRCRNKIAVDHRREARQAESDCLESSSLVLPLRSGLGLGPFAYARQAKDITQRHHLEEKAMSQPSLEERIVKLERMMDTVLQNLDVFSLKKDWRRTAGMFDGDPLMQKIIEEGQRIREEDRRKTG